MAAVRPRLTRIAGCRGKGALQQGKCASPTQTQGSGKTHPFGSTAPAGCGKVPEMRSLTSNGCWVCLKSRALSALGSGSHLSLPIKCTWPDLRHATKISGFLEVSLLDMVPWTLLLLRPGLRWPQLVKRAEESRVTRLPSRLHGERNS